MDIQEKLRTAENNPARRNTQGTDDSSLPPGVTKVIWEVTVPYPRWIILSRHESPLNEDALADAGLRVTRIEVFERDGLLMERTGCYEGLFWPMGLYWHRVGDGIYERPALTFIGPNYTNEM